MNELPKRLHILLGGRVQGVGFRAAAAQMAADLGLNGWVRNLPSGKVEASFEGMSAQLERAKRWCETGPRFARVDHIETAWHDDLEGHDAFEIRR